MHIFSPKKEAVVIVLTMLLSAGIFAVTGYASAQHADQPDGNQLLAQQNTNDPDPPENACMDGVDNDGNDDPDFADPECCEGSIDSESSGDCTFVCNDDSDNDGDGLTDLDDPMCETADDTESPKNTVPVEDDNSISVRANDNSPPSWRHSDPPVENKSRYSSADADTVGFEQQLPGNASVTFSQRVFGNWLVEWGDGEIEGVDPDEYGTIDTTVTFYDKNHTKVAEWELDGAAGYTAPNGGNDLEDRVEGKDYYLDGYDNLNEENQISRTFSDVGGAVYMEVRNSTYSNDDLEDRGIKDESDDYQTDVYVRTFNDNISLDISNDGNPPTADDDGTVDAGICTDSDGLVIDVLDNDGDDNGNDYDKSNIEITEITQEASKGAAQIFEDEGTDKIFYTPNGDETGDDSFEYKAEFPDGTTDTATVTVDVTDGSCEGSITVEVEDQNGNPVNMDTIDITYDGGNCASDSNVNQLSCSPTLQDSGAIGTYSVSDPDYDVVDRDKETDAPDNHQGDPTRTELGF